MNYTDKEIATTLLEDAIRFYYSRNYISSMPIAAAADGFLANLCNEKKIGDNGLKILKEYIVKNGFPENEIQQLNLNSSINFLKHRDPKGEFVRDTKQAKIHSKQFLLRAIINYALAFEEITESMKTFTSNVAKSEDSL